MLRRSSTSTRRKIITAKDRFAKGLDLVLVGTYREKQLNWIKRHGIYNFPLSDKPLSPDSRIGIDLPSCGSIVKELWLYADAKAKRHCFEAVFIGIQTRAEFLAANPSYAKISPGKGRAKKYLVFKTKVLDCGPRLNDSTVVARVADFASGRSKKAAKAIKAYHADGELVALADYLPSELSKLPRSRLRVCEAAVQLDFSPMLFPGRFIPCEVPTEIKTQQINVIDLFAGCGGMSLGFELAGFTPKLAVEKDAWAAETYSYNHRNVNVVTGDITKIISPKDQYPQREPIFGIIGGPPCQGFSLSGDRDPKDPRNSLFMDYMRFVRDFRPKFFIMENVPGILSSVTKKGESVKSVILSVASKLGYNVAVLQLDASHYGVPQSRLRVFFVGIRNDYPFDPERLHPVATTADKPITIRQAISDLPPIKACEGSESMEYATLPSNPYQVWCRKESTDVANHVAMRHTKRLVERFHVIKWGESAADVPQEHMQRKRGNASVISGKVYSQNNMRPFPDRPSPTVPASFQSNFVHPLLDRNYTAREGARLQSFPDNYIFRGRRTTMSWEKNLSQYQQIGNAVPPLLAKALGLMIISYFNDISSIRDFSKKATP